jgi:hypothetical protein
VRLFAGSAEVNFADLSDVDDLSDLAPEDLGQELLIHRSSIRDLFQSFCELFGKLRIGCRFAREHIDEGLLARSVCRLRLELAERATSLRVWIVVEPPTHEGVQVTDEHSNAFAGLRRNSAGRLREVWAEHGDDCGG